MGYGLLAAGCGGLLARYLPIPGHPVLYLVVASPLLLWAIPAAFVVLLASRRRVAATGAAVLSVAIVGVQAPWYVPASADSGGTALRIMTINMLFGRAEPGALVRAARERADVVMVQELTDDAAAGMAAAGMADDFPYSALDVQPDARGVGIYSRHRMVDSESIDGYNLAMVTARIRVDGVPRDPTLLSVHLAAPWPQPIGDWQRDITRLPGTLTDLAARADGGAVVVGGDFNATVDMRPFRALLSGGYRDAAEQSGAGRQPTFPANRRIPAVLGIDHVVTRAATATSTTTVEVPGTDHRALVVTVSLPRT